MKSTQVRALTSKEIDAVSGGLSFNAVFQQNNVGQAADRRSVNFALIAIGKTTLFG